MRPDSRVVTLPDGTALTIRAIRPDDAERERAFIDGLSARSGYQRAFRALHGVSAEEIARLTQVDFQRDAAIVAVRGLPEEIVGVARYVRDDEPDGAEFAIVVADEWQQHGLGRILLDELFDIARAGAIRKLHGVVLRSNRGMLDFVKEAGFVVEPLSGDATVMSAVKDL